MATEPVSEKLIREVIAECKKISQQAGDNTNVAIVRRYDPYHDWEQDPAGDRPLIEVEHAGEEKAEELTVYITEVTVNLWCLFLRDLTPGQSLDESLNRFGHDVEQKLIPAAKTRGAQLNRIDRIPLNVLQPSAPNPGFRIAASFSFTVDREDLSLYVSP